MSYILEALKKSDQQRQRDATPTLTAAQATVVVEKRSRLVYYGLLAMVLLGAGVAIGWWHPWQAEPSVHKAESIAARLPILRQTAPAMMNGVPETTGNTAKLLPAPNAIHAAQPAPMINAKPAEISETHIASAPVLPAAPSGAEQEQRAIPMSELPPAIRQEIPSITIEVHAYSDTPARRLVSINSRILHEGESLTPALKLEQITPDGVIFTYKGYRFQRGIR